MVYRLGVAILIMGCASISLALPPCVCGRNLKPVCGSNGQTYNNQCLLDCAATTNPGLRLESPGSCRSKRENVDDGALCACPAIFAPVCGTDDQTYPNSCVITCDRSNNVQVQYEGECREKREIDADFLCACPDNIDPVCGSDGQTYPNQCLLDCEKDIKLQYKGECRTKRDNIDPVLPCACPFNIDPVCGSDGQTYASKCALECENKNVQVQYEGMCRQKRENARVPCACPANIDPVCGSDDRTYPNPCILKCRHNVEVKYTGRCRSKREEIQVASLNLPKCECALDSKPVCGSDGLTYNNPCLLNCGKLYNEDLHVEHDGECKSDRIKVVAHSPSCACTRNFLPVCASDGVTYGNPCLMKCSSKDISIVHEGPC